MDDKLDYKNLGLVSYFYDKNEDLFILTPNENKSIHQTYEETSEHIKIIKSLISNNIKFEERDNGDIKVAF